MEKIMEKKSTSMIYTFLLSLYLVVTGENDIYEKIGLVTLVLSTTYLACISTNVCVRCLKEKTNLFKATP